MSQNTRYKNENKIHVKRRILGSILVLTLFLLFCIILLSSLNAKNQEQQLIGPGNFSSIEDILKYYGCKFKKSKNSEIQGFYLDIYTSFKYDLYNEDESNEKFYNNLIDEIANFLNYNSFRLIDETKEEKIEIQVLCGNSKIQTIFINGIEDYFIYMDSQIALKKYEQIPTTELEIQAPELINCIQNSWNSSSQFGTRESIFQNYYIYFDEGINVRIIDGKVYNIVFTKNYVNSVVNGFTVGTEHDIIISKIGTPTFKSEDGRVIGYKSNDIYAFFEKDQISIYRNTTDENFNEFFKLVDDFLAEKYSLLEFMNELTYLWPDYEEYIYDAESVFLSYPNKGIDIKLNYDNMDGIILYNNIGVNQEIANKYLQHTEFVAQLKVDNIYNAELRRVERQKSLKQKCKEFKENFEEDDNRNRGKIYNYYADLDSNENIMSMYFISQNEQFVDCELRESINSYIWLNETCLAYSIRGKGIYYYDLKSQTKGIIITGDEKYELNSYKNSVLKYDESEVLIQF